MNIIILSLLNLKGYKSKKGLIFSILCVFHCMGPLTLGSKKVRIVLESD